jgi:predicted  nucleic acid-binding Zn-ribbon protein
MNLVKSFAVVAGLMLATAGCGHHHGYHHGEGDRAASAERGKQAMAEAVQKAVPDAEKAKRVQEAIGEIMDEARQSYKANREQHRKLYELNANYNATPEEFTKILDDLNNGRMRTGAKILAIRFKIKETLTADEWKALTDNLNAARGGYMHGHGSMEGKEGKKEGY